MITIFICKVETAYSNVMVWICISDSFVVDLVKTEVNMKHQI